jgi:hypothetical protein
MWTLALIVNNGDKETERPYVLSPYPDGRKFFILSFQGNLYYYKHAYLTPYCANCKRRREAL